MQLFHTFRDWKSKILRDQRRMTEWVLGRVTERRNSSTAKMHSMTADKHCLSDQVGPGQLQSKLDRTAFQRDLIVGMELQKKDPRVSGYQNGQVVYKQPPTRRRTLSNLWYARVHRERRQQRVPSGSRCPRGTGFRPANVADTRHPHPLSPTSSACPCSLRRRRRRRRHPAAAPATTEEPGPVRRRARRRRHCRPGSRR